jgi:hypothetical protein
MELSIVEERFMPGMLIDSHRRFIFLVFCDAAPPGADMRTS